MWYTTRAKAKLHFEFYTFMETIGMWKGIQTTNLFLSIQFSFFFTTKYTEGVSVCVFLFYIFSCQVHL